MRPKDVPTGRLARFTKIAALGASAGVGALLRRDPAVTASRTVEVLGTMRGLATKLGQMVSYVDGMVPEAQRGAYETAMRVLRDQAPTSHPEAVRALVAEELGKPLDQLFDEWSEVPIASASIGQVHRARIGDRPVAVKVQHPQIREAMQSDLASAGLLESLGSIVGGRRFNTDGLLAVARARFGEELDYAHEARQQELFAEIHRGDPRIVIPSVVRDRSSPRVLTMEWMTGKSLDEAAAAPVEARREWATTLWRFVYRAMLVGGAFNADPHPGNYFFQDDGRVAFLDFGCIQKLPEERALAARKAHESAGARDEASFRSAVARLLDVRKGRLGDFALDYTRQCFEPLFASPYRIDRRFVAALVERSKDMSNLAMKTPRDEFFAFPTELFFFNRLQFGFFSVLARLDVEVDYAAVDRSYLT